MPRTHDTEDLALEKHSITTGPLLYTLMAVRDGEIVAVGRYDNNDHLKRAIEKGATVVPTGPLASGLLEIRNRWKRMEFYWDYHGCQFNRELEDGTVDLGLNNALNALYERDTLAQMIERWHDRQD